MERKISERKLATRCVNKKKEKYGNGREGKGRGG